jgi:hypothetical protein
MLQVAGQKFRERVFGWRSVTEQPCLFSILQFLVSQFLSFGEGNHTLEFALFASALGIVKADVVGAAPDEYSVSVVPFCFHASAFYYKFILACKH